MKKRRKKRRGKVMYFGRVIKKEDKWQVKIEK